MLPLKPPPPPPPPPAKVLRLGETTPYAGARMAERLDAGLAATAAAETLLVVDDDETIRELVAAILECRGYAVYTAAQGAAALGILRQLPIDLLVTDVDMPVLNGWELARRVRRMRPQMPILFMSGAATGADMEQTLPDGRSALLHKPFSFVALVDQVEGLLTGSASVDGLQRSLRAVAAGIDDDDDWGVGIRSRPAWPAQGTPVGSRRTVSAPRGALRVRHG